jgi:hypothetical protein
MLHRQPSSKDQARKPWGPVLGLRYFGPAKVVKERVGGGEERNSWHLTAQVSDLATNRWQSGGVPQAELSMSAKGHLTDRILCL